MIETSFLNTTFFGNSGADYLVAFVIFVVAYAALKLLQRFALVYLKRLSQKTETDVDDLIVGLFDHLKPPFYLTVSLYLGLTKLALGGVFQTVINKLVLAVVVVYATFLIAEVLTYVLQRILKGHELSESMTGIVMASARVLVWIFAIVTILSNLGFNVTSLVAGLGVGGLAIAFAFQKILEDIFSSFSIFIDKPFREGDTIMIGTDVGVVERIGIKTTRLRTPKGEELVVSNRELTSVRVNNFGRMERRRNLITIGIAYETPLAKIKKVPTIAQKICDSLEGVTFGRAHFKEYADFSLNFEITYYAETSDYTEYLDAVQKFNQSLFEKFNKEGIEFAYPTQTLYVKK